VIVVATADFELYHETVSLLRDRGVTFTTVEPGDSLPDGTTIVVTAPTDDVAVPADVEHVVTAAGDVRHGIDEALAVVRGGRGRTVVGVDPGTRPGIAVLSGEVVVAAFHVPLSETVETIRREVEGAHDPLVRVGDGARLQGSTIVNDLDDVPVELVDETGTTPYLGSGARGMGDVLAAVNIARLEGERVDSRDIEPTEGELGRIKEQSRRQSAGDRTITTSLARRVAEGELTVEEALDEHRDDEDAGTRGDDGGDDGDDGSN
jgi:hypothetical protein